MPVFEDDDEFSLEEEEKAEETSRLEDPEVGLGRTTSFANPIYFESFNEEEEQERISSEDSYDECCRLDDDTLIDVEEKADETTLANEHRRKTPSLSAPL